MVRLLNTEVPSGVSRKASAGRNLSELKAAATRLSRNDKYITDLTLSWNLLADEGARAVRVEYLHERREALPATCSAELRLSERVSGVAVTARA
jgi:hypothetical protein